MQRDICQGGVIGREQEGEAWKERGLHRLWPREEKVSKERKCTNKSHATAGKLKDNNVRREAGEVLRHNSGAQPLPSIPGLLHNAIPSSIRNLKGTNASHLARTIVLTSDSILLIKVLFCPNKDFPETCCIAPFISITYYKFLAAPKLPTYAKSPIWYAEESAAPLVMNELQQYCNSTQQTAPGFRVLLHAS